MTGTVLFLCTVQQTAFCMIGGAKLSPKGGENTLSALLWPVLLMMWSTQCILCLLIMRKHIFMFCQQVVIFFLTDWLTRFRNCTCKGIFQGEPWKKLCSHIVSWLNLSIWWHHSEQHWGVFRSFLLNNHSMVKTLLVQYSCLENQTCKIWETSLLTRKYIQSLVFRVSSVTHTDEIVNKYHCLRFKQQQELIVQTKLFTEVCVCLMIVYSVSPKCSRTFK